MLAFQLDIALGNEAMKSADDIAELLYRIAFDLEGHSGELTEADRCTVSCRDTNGNTVGEWKVYSEVTA